MTPQPKKPAAPRHLLVVDDDRLVLAALAEGLRAAGYRVTGTANGSDALEIAGRDAPDLALLDMRMPGMSGVELAARLRDRGVPFLFLSAYGDREMVSQAADAGALGYLVKPLDIQQIVPSIEAALRRAQEIGQLRETGEHLATALNGSREISMAVGMLMMRDRIDRERAFDLLRTSARSQRRAVAEVAAELLDSAEKMYKIKEMGSTGRRRS
jgi:AmiR/NasT family two-component response regulator